MRRILLLSLFSLAVLIAYLFLWPVPIEPVAWKPGINPGLTEEYEKNNRLASSELIAVLGVGPEDIAVGPDGLLYTGIEDGRIMRFSASSPSSMETFVNTGGRPLGLEFDASGNLIVADQHRGLLAVSNTRELSVLADASNCESLNFANDLDIDSSGTIWFSDSTQRHDKHAMADFLDGRATGRLLSFSPQSGSCQIHLDELRFANGVTLGPGGNFVLVAETLGARISRLWLKGRKAGQSDIFMDGLPGYPDNLSLDSEEQIWIALPGVRDSESEKLAERPFWRNVLQRLPVIEISVDPIAWAISVDEEGRVLANLQDWTGTYSLVTSANRIDDVLYLGSIESTAIARIAVVGSSTNKPQ